MNPQLEQVLEVELQDFISDHRGEIIKRARAEAALRTGPLATTQELANAVPLFLNQLGVILKRESADSPPDDSATQRSSTQRGDDLLEQGFTIAEVVHGYCDVFQAITELAADLGVSIECEDCHAMNQCFDYAIAEAVTEYARRRDAAASGAEVRRQGFFAHELRNQLNTAVLAFHVVKSGGVATGRTIEVLDRSLHELRELIDRSLSEVRLASGKHQRERLRVSEWMEEMEINASIDARSRGLQFSVERADNQLTIEVDRHLFTSAISNLLQNAFKFTRPSGHVRLGVRSTSDRVSIEIEDECGGLPPGAMDVIFRPFEQRGSDRSGLGLGLPISRRAIEADGGKILVRDIPGKGCVFTVEMPRAAGDSGGV